MKNKHETLKQNLLKSIKHFKTHYPENKNKIKGLEVFFDALFNPKNPKKHIRKHVNAVINYYQDNDLYNLYDFMDQIKQNIEVRKLKYSITLPCIYYKKNVPVNEVSGFEHFETLFANDKEALKGLLVITEQLKNQNKVFEFSIKNVPIYLDDLGSKLSKEQYDLIQLNNSGENS